MEEGFACYKQQRYNVSSLARVSTFLFMKKNVIALEIMPK